MSNIDERYFPKTEHKMYSLVKEGEVVVGAADKAIAEKWLAWQKENGYENSTIIKAFDFENEVSDEEVDGEVVDEILREIYEEEDKEGFHEFESGKFIYDEFEANP